jgi:hypothetical protein
MAAELVEARLLFARVGGWRLRGLRLQRAVHAFVTAVFLRRSGADEMRLDAELEPPDRKPRQSPRAVRSEWRAVVAPDRLRQAIGREGAPKALLRALDRWRDDARLDQKACVAVCDRQRIDPPLGDCQEFRVWPERLNLFMPLPV